MAAVDRPAAYETIERLQKVKNQTLCTLAYLTTLALGKGVGGGPCFQADPGLLLEITRENQFPPK